jgi:hypothetical protein
MTQVSLVKTVVRATIAASIMIPGLTGSAFACESVFCKIGDGPKRVVQDIVTPNKVDPPAPARPAAVPVSTYAAVLRGDCMDAQTGAPRADNTITTYSNLSEIDAEHIAIAIAARSDICQANGDTTRVLVPGSLRWL